MTVERDRCGAEPCVYQFVWIWPFPLTYWRLLMGLSFLYKLRPGFSKSGLTSAHFHPSVKWPDIKDVFIFFVRNGSSISRQVTKRGVGIGQSMHVFLAELRTRSRTLLSVNCENVCMVTTDSQSYARGTESQLGNSSVISSNFKWISHIFLTKTTHPYHWPVTAYLWGVGTKLHFLALTIFFNTGKC